MDEKIYSKDSVINLSYNEKEGERKSQDLDKKSLSTPFSFGKRNGSSQQWEEDHISGCGQKKQKHDVTSITKAF